MPNLYDYLAWRGDLTFAQDGVNEVDSLIFSWLSYMDLDGVVPAEGDGPTFSEAADRFFALHPELRDADVSKSINPQVTSTHLLAQLVGTARFGSLRLSHYVSELDYAMEKQFAAVTVQVDDALSYVAYRGTDNSFVGWKEDFTMSFRDIVPAQQAATAYLEAVGRAVSGSLIVGGHSKGGNLAVYASVWCEPALQQRILTVYNNDGPGFTAEMLRSDAYSRVRDRLRTIVPQSSVVGLLLDHEEGIHRVVRSKQAGLLQHNALNWQVQGAAFVCLDALNQVSQLFDRQLKDFLRGLDAAQLEAFINTLFDVLEQTGAQRLDDLGQAKFRSAKSIVKSLSHLDAQTRDMLLRVASGLAKAGGATAHTALTQKLWRRA